MADKPTIPLEEKPTLTIKEMAEIQYHTELIKGIKKNNEIMTLKISNLDLQKKVMERQIEVIEREKIIIGFRLLEEKKLLKKEKDNQIPLLQSISKKHNIDPNIKWKFDPNTREIEINEDNV